MNSALVRDSAKSEKAGPWTEELAAFLRSEPRVEAVRIDPETRTVAVATLGKVDLQDFAGKLQATLRAVDARLTGAAGAPAGYAVRRQGAAITIGRPACVTAERLWLWREMRWPEIDARPALEAPEWRRLAALAGICGICGVAGWTLGLEIPAFPGVSRAFYAAALLAGGWDAAVDMAPNLRKGRIDIHFLMLAVAAGAVSIGAWGEAVLLLFLFATSGAMEEYSLHRTQREVGSLLKSSPKRATRLLADGSEREVAVDSLEVGQRIRVRPGEAFAADGTVVKGRSASDESALTGEASPVPKDAGDPVFSGTINIWGAVDFEVVRLPSESTLQKIIRLIQTAQKMKAPSERFTEKFGSGYAYFVLGLATAMFLVLWLGLHVPAFANEPGTRSAFYRAMTLMVVSSPCALVLSIPSAILASIAWGARHGVLFRGGAAIENLAKVSVVALDKTGTLTTGEMAVVSCESFPEGRERDVLELAYALEAKSQHPIARAVVRHAEAAGTRRIEIEDFQSLTGQGLRARMRDSTLLLGRRELLEAGPLAPWAENLPPPAPDLSEVWVIGDGLVGRVLLKDRIRDASRRVLASLRASGLRTVMLTGDRRHAAESVARELGLDEVRAGLTPEGKVAAIQSLREGGRKVAMVGDGVNDAPSLAAADVSVAMGARGTDAALEQAEVILMHDRIENFLAALLLSRRARRVIRQNLTLALGVVIVMATATAFGAVPLAVGVAAHEGSTLVVCINSLRLLFGGGPGNRRDGIGNKCGAPAPSVA